MSPLPDISPSALSDRHLAKLASSGIAVSDAALLGHRSVSAAEAKSLTGHELPGLILSYSDPKGRPYTILTGKWARKPFYRLRPDWDQATKAQRERYADADGKVPKYLSPAEAGNRPYFSPLIRWQSLKPSALVLLTEGELKGDSGCAHGFPTIAGAGVTAFVDRADRGDWTGETVGSGWDCDDEDREPVSRFLPELDVFPWEFRPVGIVFDSDLNQKFQVRKALETLLTHVRARAGVGFPVILPNESDGSKNGLDDFLSRHGSEAFQLLVDAFYAQQHNRNAMVKYGPAHKMKGGTKVLGGRKKDGSPHDGSEVCVFRLTEPEPHTKAIMTWSVLKEQWAYRPGLGWYHWMGKHWEPTGDSVLLGAAIARFFDAQNWQQRQGLYAYVQEEMARRCFVPEDKWDSEQFLAFDNGVLDAQTNEFHCHDPGRYCTSVLPFDHDPFATCPNWLRFLDQTTGGDSQMQMLLRAWVKWILTPKDRQHKFPIEKSLDLVGRKGSGKGTFLDVLVQLVGEDACGSASPETFATPEGLGQLIDKKIAIDADSSGYMSGVGNYNKVVSNEAVGVKKLFKDKVTTRLGVVVVRAYNDFIAVPSSGTEGLDRRLCVVPFNHPPHSPDHSLSEKLRGELAGIFTWAWALPLAQAKALIRWSGAIKAVQSASIERFANDHPEFKYLLDDYPAGRDAVQAFDLYEGYVAWAKRNGHKSCSNTKFGSLMNELGIHHYKGNGGVIFYNIPDMRNGYDLVGYLRISPNSSEGCPQNLFDEPASTPCPVCVSEGSEGFGGLQKTENPCPVYVSEGSEGLILQSPPGKTIDEAGITRVSASIEINTTGQEKAAWKPTGGAIAVGDWVDLTGSAMMHRRGSFSIDDKHLLSQHRNPDAIIPIDALPDWIKRLFEDGPYRVLEISADGQRVKIQIDKRKNAVLAIAGLYALREVG